MSNTTIYSKKICINKKNYDQKMGKRIELNSLCNNDNSTSFDNLPRLQIDILPSMTERTIIENSLRKNTNDEFRLFKTVFFYLFRLQTNQLKK